MSKGTVASSNPNAPRMIFGRLNTNYRANKPKAALSKFGLKAMPNYAPDPDWGNPDCPVVNKMIADNYSLAELASKRNDDLERIKSHLRALSSGEETWSRSTEAGDIKVSKTPQETNREGLEAALGESDYAALENLKSAQPMIVDPELLEEHFPDLYDNSRAKVSTDSSDYLVGVRTTKSSIFKRRRKSKIDFESMNVEQLMEKARKIDTTIKEAKAARKEFTDQMAENLGTGKHEFRQGIIDVRPNLRFDKELAQEAVKNLSMEDKLKVSKRKVPGVGDLRKLNKNLAAKFLTSGTRRVQLNFN